MLNYKSTDFTAASNINLLLFPRNKLIKLSNDVPFLLKTRARKSFRPTFAATSVIIKYIICAYITFATPTNIVVH